MADDPASHPMNSGHREIPMRRILWMGLVATLATGMTACAGSTDKPPRCSGPYYPLNAASHYVVPEAGKKP
jgi:hypothetical protein